MNLDTFNSDWLRAWSLKDVEQLIAFYSEDCYYADPQTTAGLTGKTALRQYLTGLFNSTPDMIYKPDELWATPNGFCGRWYCDIGTNGQDGRMRGFDLVVLKDGLIAHNEVYVHPL